MLAGFGLKRAQVVLPLAHEPALFSKLSQKWRWRVSSVRQKEDLKGEKDNSIRILDAFLGGVDLNGDFCLAAQSSKLYHMGFRQAIRRSTLADANAKRDWRIYADFAQRLITQARKLYVDTPLDIDWHGTAYALDSTTIDLCMSMSRCSTCCSSSPARSAGIRIICVASASRDPETGTSLVFLTNHSSLPPLTICALYKARWHVELLFKWIKQRLRIKRFFGTSENAVKSQIWIAVSAYVLVAIGKKRLNLNAPLYTLLHILSLTLFEKMTLQQALINVDKASGQAGTGNQLNLLDY